MCFQLLIGWGRGEGLGGFNQERRRRDQRTAQGAPGACFPTFTIANISEKLAGYYSLIASIPTSLTSFQKIKSVSVALIKETQFIVSV